ncbi:FAD-dependent monooxygenase [Streptomyces coffeae]|uniref:FAD-dependent monooxygenase n=1 Tax=Streptomyces coffeae TaxID=621382 RepID=A0ABS1NHW9_9ACTN|nr:FAD-dependent monooxygenase [Streptomyces coffeae]MBL1099665.1 FAD-dependent monooxygenase [Streptomyces coffeae]
MRKLPKGKILISGAGVAGPALAYWLHRYGFAVTVVEKAPAMRGSGYPVDVRGTALEVVRRMGVLPRLREAHIRTRRIGFVGADGKVLSSMKPEALVGGTEGRDIELPRGDLAVVLYDAVRDDVEFLFGDSIAALHGEGGGKAVEVVFAGGRERAFDLVIGADGLHSRTRGLAFGPEARFHRYLGYCFAGFTMPNRLGLSHEALVCNVPGRAATLYAPGEGDQLHAFLIFARPDPPYGAFADPGGQRDLVASAFAGCRWEIPRMVDALRASEDLFFDVVSQIRMPRWSRGRVALVGDAAYAPSFLSGQGTSIALAGAYVLAGELAAGSGRGGHTEALAAYERVMRTFVELNQALADGGGVTLMPRTRAGLWLRNRMLRMAPLLARIGPVGRKGRSAYTALTLPEYPEPAGV